jgi:perosamine synthetase
MIFTGFQPSATKRDISLALGYLLFPWKWGQIVAGEYEARVRRVLRKLFSVSHAYTFDSGRSALEIALRSLNIKEGDEVILQAYTCVVVTNAIQWTGAKPVYVDVREDFTMNVEELQKNITSRTKAIIVQHTFGIPSDIDAICVFAKAKGIPVIEDCAHVLGGEYQGKKLGTIGDIGMFSFGTDKVISSARGGALITTNDVIGESIEKIYKEISLPKKRWIIPYLWNYPLFALGKSLYRLGVGKLFLAVLKKLSISGRVIYEKEKQGIRSHFVVSRLANSLAHILSYQLEQLDDTNMHRREIAHWYEEEIATKKVKKPKKLTQSQYVRYPLRVKNPRELHYYFKKKGILLGEWYDTVIAPSDSNLTNTGYIQGSCPVAEKLANESINLPTSRHITVIQADKISKMINSFYDNHT